MDQNALAHRSIRQFKADAIDWQSLVAAAQATSSSEFLQSFSLIRVTDAKLRQAIQAISTSPCITGNGELFIFVVDTARDIAQTPAATNLDHFTNWNAFLAGCFDATLAAQNMLSTAEHSGLGGVMLGSILNDPAQMIALLHLPKYTFPLLGLMIGVPDEAPESKPRLPKAAVLGENTYPARMDLSAYDVQVSDYYAHRSTGARVESFSSLIEKHLSADQHHRSEIGAILKSQGFNLPQ